ncbi:MAG: peroxiredoxin [Candidatus Calescibacterium sp.]|nr:peroxiredoxin [Candidatus Calescibacterium sp.]MCX7734783.1 peroxiredoxin [bacterium]MDW8087374.1 peroxiredoxin [Candidatus Calescibacterium sp.]
MAKVGDNVPEFSGKATNDQTISSESLKGRWSVIFFYPKAFTPGCTKEVCSVRDGYSEIKNKFNVQIIGVSKDTLEKQKKFKEKYKLEYELVADEKGEIINKFGVKGIFGNAQRKTFIVSPEGKIAYVFEKVDVNNHHKQILEVLEKIAK